MKQSLPGTGERVLIAGLGNPGPKYAGNRHNVGFLVLDELAERIGGRFTSHKAGADVLEGHLAGRRVVLVKPRSFMNLSGGPVSGVARFFHIGPEGVVVVHDELDLDYGTLRLKIGGGDGGHNGLRSITASLRTNEYYRVRFGVGRPPGRMDAADFVLKDFPAVERRELPVNLDRGADAVSELIGSGLATAQNTFHTR